MPILDCNVRTCIHNVEAKCKLETINVDGKAATYPSATECASFEAKKEGCCSNSIGMAGPTCIVDCKAEKCCFNENQKCQANHIGIAGSDACDACDTECASFRCDCK